MTSYVSSINNMGFPCNHKSSSLYAGVFFVCFFLFNAAAFAQIQPNDSIPADTVPVIKTIVKGKGGFENDSIYTNVKTRQPESTVKKVEHKTEAKLSKEPAALSEKDTLKPHNPKMAMAMSALLPGLGQIYNRKYWKLPIVYVGIGTCVYFIATETSLYSKYKETYRFRMKVDGATTDYFPGETDNTIVTMKEYHHRNVEISYIAAGLIYLLNIVDASVDAHLYDFNVTDDLSLRIEPSLQRPIITGNSFTGTGLTLSLKF